MQPNNKGDKQNKKKQLNLFIPSPNNKQQHDLGKNFFVITPSKNSTQDLSLYWFLGVLMGICIWTGVHLTLDLPPFFWKPLVGDKITMKDIEEIDIGFCELLWNMQSYDQDTFESIINESFAVNLSDGTQKEIVDGGYEKAVTYLDWLEFIEKSLITRLKESYLQSKAIRAGISSIVPQALLNLATFNELNMWICGKIEVDLELL